jgi:coenzyme A diphosphatase NUDT7
MVTSSSSASSTEPIFKKRAAVLVLLFENTREEIHVVLTKRSADMNSHAGQVAFPGGKLDDEDLGDDIECALREAKEEIGLNRNHVKVLTVLPPILSAGLISVRPVVCAVTDVRNFSKMDWLRNQPSEVERTFSVRLDQFLREDERHTFNDHAWKNAPCAIRVHSFRVDEEEMIFVGKEGKESSKESSSSSNNNNNNSETKKKKTSVCWGLTAAVLIETAKIVYNKEPEFERDCVLEGGASIWDLVANKDGTGVELRPGVSKI